MQMNKCREAYDKKRHCRFFVVCGYIIVENVDETQYHIFIHICPVSGAYYYIQSGIA